MKAETKKILLEFDEIGSYETPKDFDYDELELHIEKFKTKLENIFNSQFYIDNQIQDASFICDIKIPNEMLKNNQTEYLYTIRFSNFGKLATINGIENLNTKNLEIIKTELKNYDFIFLEPNEIDFDYDGKFENFKNIHSERNPTWFERYFDYL